jgi:transcriptional regulator with XRE-family HTH domain
MPKKRPDICAAVRHRIRGEMLSRDWSAYDLADRSGVSANHIYRILKGEQSPSLEKVRDILRAFGKAMVIVDEADLVRDNTKK